MHTDVEVDTCSSDSFHFLGASDDVSSGLQGASALGTNEVLPSLHEITQKQVVQVWSSLRPLLLRAAITSSALPIHAECLSCSEEANCRCLECGPQVYFCEPCHQKAHQTVNVFHSGEIWQVLQSCIAL